MTTNKQLKTEGGFTLVELAIVLMIIGLLIGGILRGQELMENARVTSTVQQTKAYDGATTTFRDAYSAIPGDMLSPGTRLANCTNDCAIAGDGNGIVGVAVTDNNTHANGTENVNFWRQMGAVHLISGVNPTSAAPGTTAAWGSQFPAAKIAGGFHVVHMATATGTTPALSGPFLVLMNNPNGTTATGATGINAISPLRAAQIDRKLDDGLPRTGDVIGSGTSTACLGAGTSTGNIYDETLEQKDCNLLIRIQN